VPRPKRPLVESKKKEADERRAEPLEYCTCPAVPEAPAPPLSSAEQLMIPLASAVSVPPLEKEVQSRVLILRPPLVRVSPASVDVADVCIPVVLIPPENVEVLVLVTAKAPSKVEEAFPFPVTRRLPWIARPAPGEVVPPIPTRPRESMMNAVEVAPPVVVEISRSGDVSAEAPAIVKRPCGVVVFPTPMFPFESMEKIEEEAEETASKSLVASVEVAVSVREA
jgi:hypothetical protein